MIRKTILQFMFLAFLVPSHAFDCAKKAVVRCFIPLLTEIQQKFSSKEISFNLKMKMGFLGCLNEVYNECGAWNYLLEVEELENVCAGDSCTSEESSNSNLHMYSVSKCLYEHKDYFTGCLVQSIIKTFEKYGVASDNLKDKACFPLKFCTKCFEEIAESKCGIVGKDFIKKKLKSLMPEGEDKACENFMAEFYASL